MKDSNTSDDKFFRILALTFFGAGIIALLIGLIITVIKMIFFGCTFIAVGTIALYLSFADNRYWHRK